MVIKKTSGDTQNNGKKTSFQCRRHLAQVGPTPPVVTCAPLLKTNQEANTWQRASHSCWATTLLWGSWRVRRTASKRRVAYLGALVMCSQVVLCRMLVSVVGVVRFVVLVESELWELVWECPWF